METNIKKKWPQYIVDCKIIPDESVQIGVKKETPERIKKEIYDHVFKNFESSIIDIYEVYYMTVNRSDIIKRLNLNINKFNYIFFKERNFFDNFIIEKNSKGFLYKVSIVEELRKLISEKYSWYL